MKLGNGKFASGQRCISASDYFSSGPKENHADGQNEKLSSSREGSVDGRIHVQPKNLCLLFVYLRNLLVPILQAIYPAANFSKCMI